MAPHWAVSAGKHGISRADATHAILHATYTADLTVRDDGMVERLYIGPEHAQTDRELEIIALVGTSVKVIHVMQLGPKFRRYREENPQ